MQCRDQRLGRPWCEGYPLPQSTCIKGAEIKRRFLKPKSEVAREDHVLAKVIRRYHGTTSWRRWLLGEGGYDDICEPPSGEGGY